MAAIRNAPCSGNWNVRDCIDYGRHERKCVSGDAAATSFSALGDQSIRFVRYGGLRLLWRLNLANQQRSRFLFFVRVRTSPE